MSTKTILQELSTIGVNKNPEMIVLTRGSNLIESVINLLELVYSTYPENVAEKVERKILNSIKARDVTKFKRSIAGSTKKV